MLNGYFLLPLSLSQIWRSYLESLIAHMAQLYAQNHFRAQSDGSFEGNCTISVWRFALFLEQVNPKWHMANYLRWAHGTTAMD